VKIFLYMMLLGLFMSGCTASCSREIKSIRSNWSGGISRTCTLIHPYSGKVLAEYTGNIDLPKTSTDHILFDVDQNRRIVSNGAIMICEETIIGE
jgi:hypothetical protein